MMLFLPIPGWSFSESLGQFDGSDCRTTCNLHKKGGDPVGGVPAAAPMIKSIYFL